MKTMRTWKGIAPALCVASALSACGAASQQAIQPATPDDSVIAAARDVIELARYAALITLDEQGSPRARAMDAFVPDEEMVVWLGTHRATRKVADIQRDPRVTLYYFAPDGSGYVSMSGIAELVDDPTEKAQRWKEAWEQYYTDREAQYLLIKVNPLRMEVVNYRRGLVGDPSNWRPPAVEFGQ